MLNQSDESHSKITRPSCDCKEPRRVLIKPVKRNSLNLAIVKVIELQIRAGFFLISE